MHTKSASKYQLRGILALVTLLGGWGWVRQSAAEDEFAAWPSLVRPVGGEQVEEAAPGCSDCGHCEACLGADPGCGLFTGGDFLLVRPRFSEANAFARGYANPGVSLDLFGEEIDFDYTPSFRVFAGYQVPDTGIGMKLTYWNLFADANNYGTVSVPGQFIVDPFGFVADPFGLFAPPGAGGDAVSTRTTVNLNVVDLDFFFPVTRPGRRHSFLFNAGVRVADVEQSYVSVVSLAGTPLSVGDYFVNFTGIGPHVGFEGRRSFLGERFSLFANLNASLLVGTYDVEYSVSPSPNPFFPQASQTESLSRTIPVLESELGAAFRLTDGIRLTGGWLFQSWWDLGASGGTFGGMFTGADDANMMSFDGLVLRCEVLF